MILIFIISFIFYATLCAQSLDQEGERDESFLFNFYQEHISVVDGNRCAMYPSCSRYASRSFQKHGFIVGWIMACDRLVRCGRDEADIARHVIVDNHELIHDPVEANDFWWFEKENKK
ncbi:MAG: membrane protein insertion efficiency factor YidD [Desulfobacula sp.]|nr:membrane protein insertion efficiency factor YidD [Desulfobacula sp.]